jgi:PleD family two-component response regulator
VENTAGRWLGSAKARLMMHQQNGILLLVDGEAPRAERMAKRLAHLGYEIQVVSDGAEALRKAHELRPEVIVAAATLPLLDGHLMLEALRSKSQTRRIPVVLITESNSQEELARGWKAGADLCVPRNQGEADVLATLHRALNGFRRDVSSRELALVS